MNEKYYLEYPIEKKRFSKTDLKIVDIVGMTRMNARIVQGSLKGVDIVD